MAQKKWLIRDIRGRIRGPYSTTNILDQIASGAIVGDEHLSPFPGNTWVPIAQDPEFYDRLLSLVARESTEKADTQSGKERGRAVAVDPNSFNSIQDKTPVGKALGEESSVTGVEGLENTIELQSGVEDDPDNSVIELTDIRNFIRVETIKKAKFPILGLVVGIVVLFGLFFTSEEEVDRIHLLRPQKKSSRLSEDQVRSKTRRGTAFYVRDSYNNYIKAQNEFVQVIEGDPRNAEVYGFLCMTYF